MRRGALAGRLERTTAPSDAAARLELLEVLLASDDLGECAQMALHWLADQRVGVEVGLCAVVDTERARLVGLAGHRVPARSVAELSVSLDDHAHPLMRALGEGTEVRLTAEEAEQIDLGPARQGRPLSVVPLRVERGSGEGETAGLLVLAPAASPRATSLSRWVARSLVHKLVRLSTCRRLADAQRRFDAERRLLHRILNAVPDPVLLTDGEGRMMIANARAESLLASRDNESEGRRRAVALNNMLFSAATFQRRVGDGDRDRTTETRELLLVDPSEGTDLLFELISTVADDAHSGAGVVSILRNVTDLRRASDEIEENYRRLHTAEAQVRAERDRLDLIIDSVADPILVTNLAGQIILMNAPAERLFTVAPGSSSTDAQRAVRANDAQFSSFVSNLFLARRDDCRWRGEMVLVDPASRSQIPVEAISGEIISGQAEATAVVTILHDRSEAIEKAQLYEQVKLSSEQLEEKVRAATAELVRQNELLLRQHIELEQASALKSQFLANVSHEFRTPLNAILGYTSMLLQGVNGELPAAQRRTLTRVETNSQHLLRIIDDILDISRIEAGRMPLHVATVDLRELVGEVMSQVEPLLPSSRVAVTTHLAPRLPALYTDRQKLKQILLNLLTNALKFTRDGSVVVRARYDRARDAISLAVADTGIGIAPADHDRIFEDFRQADNSPTREYGGTGLGLSICRRLATMLDGRITLESEIGQGSTFTLVLPRRRRRRRS